MLIVEDLPCVDIADLKELPDWPESKSRGFAKVCVQTEEQKIICTVKLIEDMATFGIRTWFACPICGTRRKHLHVNNGHLACRICLGAQYLRHSWPGSRWREDVGRPVLKAWRQAKRAA